MTFSDLSPRNVVERLLSEMNEGRIEPENFARELIDQQVFIPIQDEKHQIAGFQLSTKATRTNPAASKALFHALPSVIKHLRVRR